MTIIAFCQKVLSLTNLEISQEIEEPVLFTLEFLSGQNSALIPVIATRQCIADIMKYLESGRYLKNALNCMAAFLESEHENIVMWAIQAGFLGRAQDILNCGETIDKHKALWAISNITGGTC